MPVCSIVSAVASDGIIILVGVSLCFILPPIQSSFVFFTHNLVLPKFGSVQFSPAILRTENRN